MAKFLAVDIGGTFTDVVVMDADTGDVTFEKAPTTPEAPEDGVFDGVEKAMTTLATTETFFHGTTIGINTILERSGARTGLLTTAGFRDILEIGTAGWPMYRLHWRAPDPLVPRYLRREVRERVDPRGNVVAELADEDVEREARALLDEGVEAIAVCFLHSYAYPDHELRAGEIIASIDPTVEVALSHLITREYREYERTVTSVVEAMVRPRLAEYLEALERRTAEEEFEGRLLLTRCDGGVMARKDAAKACVRTLTSGPASGVMGAAWLSRAMGIENVVAADMGGTSFDAAVIWEGQPSFSSSAEWEGLRLLMPVVELEAIGAGGGSIASVDEGLGLNVGPKSAGAVPGPICYGLGGTAPTVTDAAVVSGLIDPNYFLGGEISLDRNAAVEGISEQIAKPLGLTTEEAAAGILEVAETKMATMLQGLTIERGRDPRDFALLAYGGGGPLVAASLMERLEIARTIVPISPATFSAWGMLTLDLVHDVSRTYSTGLEGLTPRLLSEIFSELTQDAHERLLQTGVPVEEHEIYRFLDMRYDGQEHTLIVPLEDKHLHNGGFEALKSSFDHVHERLYGYALDVPVDVVTYRVRSRGSVRKPNLKRIAEAARNDRATPKARRTATHRWSGGTMEWAVYDRSELGAGTVISGPAIIEEPAATIPVNPRQVAHVHELGAIVIEPNQ